MFFFFRILISKQIAVASLFSLPLKIKTQFHKKYYGIIRNIFTKVECIGNTQIIHMEETEITQGAMGLLILPNCQVPNGFFWYTCKFIFQNLKYKHLVCLSFLSWQVFWGNERKYITHIPGLKLKFKAILSFYLK